MLRSETELYLNYHVGTYHQVVYLTGISIQYPTADGIKTSTRGVDFSVQNKLCSEYTCMVDRDLSVHLYRADTFCSVKSAVMTSLDH